MLDLFDPKFLKYYCRDARASYDILHALAKEYEWGLAGKDLGDHWGVLKEFTGTSEYDPNSNYYGMEIQARTRRDDPITIFVKYFPAWRSKPKNKAFIRIIRVVPGYDWMTEIYETHIAPDQVESKIDGWVEEITRGQPPSDTTKNSYNTDRHNLR
jgi:hypothetical protein